MPAFFGSEEGRRSVENELVVFGPGGRCGISLSKLYSAHRDSFKIFLAASRSSTSRVSLRGGCGLRRQRDNQFSIYLPPAPGVTRPEPNF